jgi:hypothetical protein
MTLVTMRSLPLRRAGVVAAGQAPVQFYRQGLGGVNVGVRKILNGVE